MCRWSARTSVPTICWLQLLYERKIAIPDTITLTNCAVDSLMNICCHCCCIFELEHLFLPCIWTLCIGLLNAPFFAAISSFTQQYLHLCIINNSICIILTVKFHASGFAKCQQIKSDQLNTHFGIGKNGRWRENIEK